MVQNSFIVGTQIPSEDLPVHLQFLLDCGYVKTSERNSVQCRAVLGFELGSNRAGCGERNFVTHADEPITCRNCGQELSFSVDEINVDRIVLDIDYGKIQNDCVARINQLNLNGLVVSDVCRGAVMLSYNDMSCLIMFNHCQLDLGTILRLATEMDRAVLIEVDGSRILDKTIHYYASFDVHSFIQSSDSDLKNLIKYMPPIGRVDALLKRHREVSDKIHTLAKDITWMEYEGEVCNFLIEKLRKNYRKLEEYKYLIKHHRVMSTIHIQVGGAGRTDFRIIHLESYLDVLYDESIIIDAKLYTTTPIDNKVLEKIEHHVTHDPTDPRRAVILTTTDKVKCWDEIINFYNITGQYRIIVLTPSILAHVLCYFELDEEVLEYLKHYTDRNS